MILAFERDENLGGGVREAADRVMMTLSPPAARRVSSDGRRLVSAVLLLSGEGAG
jgi:hypothetical protein